MIHEIDIFRRLIDKYRFTEPIAPEVQSHVTRSRARALMSSLKAVKHYSFVYGFVMTVYFEARKMGLKPSIFACRIISLIMAITVAAMLAGAVYLAASSATNAELKPALPDTVPSKTGSTDLRDNTRPDDGPPKIFAAKYRLGVQPFTAANVDSAKANDITRKIFNELINLKGSKKVIKIGTAKSKNVNRMLMGSVGKMGKRYVISAKVIDVEKTNVLFGASENATTDDDIDRACGNIAQKVSEWVE
jgi:hypothetical protein